MVPFIPFFGFSSLLSMRLWKYYIIFVYILQGKIGKTEKNGTKIKQLKQPKYKKKQKPKIGDERNIRVNYTVHSDAFFRSQRDINRHGSWLDFWKIQVNLVNFISGTFGTAWDKYFKNGLTFGCLREKKVWKFDLEIIFFKQKQVFGIFI